MENPDVILDGDGDIWTLDPDEASAVDPYYENYTHGHELLSRLIKDYSPVRALTVGEKVELPFKPVANGTWVEFDRDILVRTPSGMVHDYNEDKLFYRVIINVPRNAIKGSL